MHLVPNCTDFGNAPIPMVCSEAQRNWALSAEHFTELIKQGWSLDLTLWPNSGSHHWASQTNGATLPVAPNFPHSLTAIWSAITVKLTEPHCLLTTSF